MMGPGKDLQQHGWKARVPAVYLALFLLSARVLFPGNSHGGIDIPALPSQKKSITTILYPDQKKNLTTAQCMQCHPSIANLLRTAGKKHGLVECRQCHREFHTYVAGKTNYEDILPKCSRCHEHPHGEKLIECSNCHREAHAPLSIPANRSLSQGCYICHPEPDKQIKTFSTKHTELYCTACHHTRHGYIPDCLECHQQHTGSVVAAGRIADSQSPLAQCTSCHPPHKALKVTYPDNTMNSVCSYCHRNAKDMLQRNTTKHTALPCIKCHPEQHKTIKRCIDCHGRPHPEKMMKNRQKFSSCGGCHGVAHSIIR